MAHPPRGTVALTDILKRHPPVIEAVDDMWRDTEVGPPIFARVWDARVRAAIWFLLDLDFAQQILRAARGEPSKTP